ncbi:type II toxin-antitoxin system VapB family antitoxin [Arthrobacter sp. ISL-85]|uniref:type II toxin-antitoxin system VapB family antitoxin n=1 Tax=Arthrobacter sp. ISL-85 TaxID=2819115 RepID=UPI001BEA4A4D|nr:type II toxin-antitoxin system VapB family antitoxin [Arthrobacter sp. ISL-85]MBT2566612.1 type II toxin-antitoxin system VapB family antitoxin [Arthrobacter sp. ISL-85]
MTSAKWLHVPTMTVCIADLVATQPGILLHALVNGSHPVGGDAHPHVIEWGGTLYLEDGHHRALRALIDGEQTLTARVLRVGAGKSLGLDDRGGFAG